MEYLEYAVQVLAAFVMLSFIMMTGLKKDVPKWKAFCATGIIMFHVSKGIASVLGVVIMVVVVIVAFEKFLNSFL